MRRIVLAIAVLAVIAMGAGAARADQTPIGNLGAPDYHRTGPIDPTFLYPVHVPTALCPTFASGNEVIFNQPAVWESYKQWDLTDSVDIAWVEALTKLTGSTSTGGFTYTIRIDARFSYYYVGWSVGSRGSGKATITRSDGARMVGDAGLGFANAETGWPAAIAWIGTPTCR